MPSRLDAQKQDRLDAVAALARTRLPGKRGAEAEAFVRILYADLPAEDLLEDEAENLYGAALALMRFGAMRQPGELKLRVYNPRMGEQGWHARHTIVEIVNDNMPFLVDSATMALNRLGLTVHLVIHPILSCRRDGTGNLAAFSPDGTDAEAETESWMHIQVEERTAPAVLAEIEAALRQALGDVRAAVEDWQTMRQRMMTVIDVVERRPAAIPEDEATETAAFLRWAHDDHFTFLGYREVLFDGKGRQMSIAVREDSGLGILRSPEVLVFEGLRHRRDLPLLVHALTHQPGVLTVVKANLRATVHRPVHLDVIAVKTFAKDGSVAGEHMFVGLFTSVAYSTSPRRIPYLRHKVDAVAQRSGYDPRSHSGKALLHVLETFPRDELFQASEADLLEIATGIVQLQERQRIALFLRRDNFERFVSAFVYVPRERYNRPLREAFEAILESALDGRITAAYTQFGDEPLGRIHFIVRTQPGAVPEVDLRDLEARLREAGRSWEDRLLAVLVETHGEERGNALRRRYGEAFPTAYRETFNAQTAVNDIGLIEAAIASSGVEVNLYRPIEAGEHELRFKLYKVGDPVPLSDALPMLENMGLRAIGEYPYEVHVEGTPVQLHDFWLETHDAGPVDIAAVRQLFHDAFERLWRGEIENDGFNRLVLNAGLQWRQVVVLRALSRFLRQASIPFSLAYMEETLTRNPDLARSIVELFEHRFDPDFEGDRSAAEAALAERIATLLDRVANLDEDRILRRFVNLVQAMLRTSYFQAEADGSPRATLAFKFDSRAVEDLPLPRPWREIFVYSPRMEGVHLRFGPVARGGIRWSDRREDFRTEILGLVKAQQVKNGVIVPVGAKGGFVLKQPLPPGDREALQAEGVACYRILIRALLDVTDNLAGETVLPPPRVVRRDGDDPYLVVAADKGTATFSDYANALAVEAGFWLGDAFASGGSAGYDHKKIGITARGAWESVKRHFRELGRDIQREDFTAVGVGDMSGDVFGNGMLLSPHIRLLGAFNHLHIFIDPDPDPAIGIAERRRLSALNRASWDSYDPAHISKGGGVFERKAKSIPLSAEIRALFDIEAEQMTPAALIKAMLAAPVDLLWFGGIGTYVKAGAESHADVGDRANDALRVDAEALRCKVVGEGANLGVTQRGRVAFARRGGRINTDFIDNSGGVDCSDHEVNIKIALGEPVQRGDMTVKQRDRLLERMTDEVADLVLRDNYQQALALSVKEAQAPRELDRHQRFMRGLERAGHLNRAIEFLPDDEEIDRRGAARQGLTRPELAILLAYAKIVTFDELLAGSLPDDPLLGEDLLRYFPEPLRRDHAGAISRHRLRREIVATAVTNSMVNRAGPTFVADMRDATGCTADDIARAYLIARDAFALRALWADIEALDDAVDAAVQIEMLGDSVRLLERAALWLLRNGERPLDIARYVEGFGPAIAALAEALPRLLPPSAAEPVAATAAGLEGRGVPAPLALRVAQLPVMAAAPDIVRIAGAAARPVAQTAAAYFDLGSRFGIDGLRAGAQAIEPQSGWHRRALAAIVDDLYGHQSALTARALEAAAGIPPEAAPDAVVAALVAQRPQAAERVSELLAELEKAGQPDLAMLAVANRALRGLAGD
ncbi:MAG: NAD-glutamate dehydrogenase [Alphaproteobacteria bacterium]